MPDFDRSYKDQQLPPHTSCEEKRRWWIWVTVAAACLLAGGRYSFAHKSGVQTFQTLAVRAISVPSAGLPGITVASRTRDTRLFVSALRTVTPIDAVTVSGRIASERFGATEGEFE